MIKNFFAGLFFMMPLIAGAQVNVSVQLPPAGFIQKSQLWNLVLMNSREDIPDLNIKMSLQDVVTGEVVLSADTREIMCGKGIKMITERDVQPVNYNYNNPDLARAYLPMGAYIACYRIYRNTSKGEELLGDECVKINIDPLSPPLLNTPADKSETETPYPQFTWMPPSPFDMFTSLSYEISVCEIKEGQQPIEAIQYNTPVYVRSNILQPIESYSTSFTKLEEGKSYAWQIAAVNGLNYSAKTEVWSFTVKKNIQNATVTGNTYLELKSIGENEGIYELKDNLLKIKYYSFDKEFNTAVVIKSNDEKVLKETKFKISYGDNLINIELPDNLTKEKVYRAEIKAADGSIHQALFRINK